ncbi:MAG: hypothetical protein GY847_35705 [Proteobacteria bacterium]|nr:hypothetical protein [Pseudomonadota bacterium]
MIKKIITTTMLTCLMCLTWSVYDVRVSPAVEMNTMADYQSIPPFVTAGAPPLVMLVMGRNHKLYYEAYNDASDLNEDGVLDVVYNPAIEYYGYFDSYKCYTYTNGLFKPTSTTTDKTVNNEAEWSGNFLNYITMSRMDTLRKVLYGGYRSTDTADETVLERAYIPQDAHSWGKEYESVDRDGYDIRDYTPLSLPQGPTGATRHLFANTTLVSETSPPLLRVLENSTFRIWNWVACNNPVAGSEAYNEYTGERQDVTDNSVDNTDDVTDGGTAGTITAFDDGDSPADEKKEKAFDDKANTKWLTYGHPTTQEFPGDPVWIQFQFNSPKRIIRYSLRTANDAEDRDPEVWELQASNDGTNWTAIDTIVDGALPSARNTRKEFVCDSPSAEGVSYTYYRLWITSRKGTGGICNSKYCIQIAEIEMMETVASSIPANATLTDYTVRVKVCDDTVGVEPNSRLYPNGNYKPIGILQRHGETERMYFGLLTGSYTKNTSGGVLRKRIGTMTDEINATTGVFIDTTGEAQGSIIKTIDRLHIQDFNYTSNQYATDCGWNTTSSLSDWIGNPSTDEGKCRNWGNPIAEMLYEGLRYFAGKTAPLAAYTYGTDSSYDDNQLGLPKPDWVDPYSTNDHCAKPFMLVLSDINPSYDSDQLPGTEFAAYSTSSTVDLNLDVGELADTIFTEEGIGTGGSGTFYIGESGNNFSGSCSPKSVSGFDDIRGLCPEEPTKEGSYYSAGVAYFGLKEDINSATGEQNVLSYYVGLASPLPEINIPVGESTITLVPFAKTIDGGGLDRSEGSFQPTMTIVDLFVDTITPTYGKFRINFEDVEQGADHDMDAVIEYEYQVNTAAGVNSVDVTVTCIYASMGYRAHLGYIISGTDNDDGVYLEVRDIDPDHSQAGDADFDYFLDTPHGQPPGGTWNDNAGLPDTHTRTFSPGSSAAATVLESPLWYAAKWGAFEDGNGNLEPDETDEWDKDGDGTPDGYFFVQNPLGLEEQLSKPFEDILRKTSSGTAASVISNSRSGEGAIYQSIFYPIFQDDTDRGKKVTWIGQVHAMLVDEHGNMRDDTNEDKILDSGDKIIRFEGSTVKKYDPDATDPDDEDYDILDINFLWSSSEWLNSDNMVTDAQRYPYTDTSVKKRYIFTFVDADEDMTPDTGEQIPFVWPSTTPSDGDMKDPTEIYPYIQVYPPFPASGGLADDIESIRSACLGATPVCSAFNDFLKNQTGRIINYIRGEDQPSYTSGAYSYTLPAFRERKADFNQDCGKTPVDSCFETCRLGDIVHSTPTMVARPAENYDLLYRDETYTAFYKKYKNRRNVLYAGANDGMFHAFNAGFYDSDTNAFVTSLDGEASFDLGAELWAYVPYNLLPHLYWLTDPDYTHVYYCDLKPKVFDAKIFAEDNADGLHPYGWGTVLVAGMRFGGGRIQADMDKTDSDAYISGTDRTMSSAYFIFDVTNPESEPVLLGEISIPGMGFTTCYPAAIPLRDKLADGTFDDNQWYLVFGSGPIGLGETADTTALDKASGAPGIKAKLFIVDLAALAGGQLSTLDSDNDPATNGHFKELDDYSFISDPVSVDYTLDFNANVVYFGTVEGDETVGWGGKLRRIVLDDPANSIDPLVPSTWDADSILIDLGGIGAGISQPVTARPSVGLSRNTAENRYERWIFFGTGRYFVTADDLNDDKQSYYGIKEPYDSDSTVDDWTWGTVNRNTTDLLDVSLARVYEGDTPESALVEDVSGDDGPIANFAALLEEMEDKKGWFLDFSETKERNLGSATLLGDILAFTTYVPNVDPCEHAGESYLYAVYYKTGTAYHKSVIGTVTDNDGVKVLRKGEAQEGLTESPNLHVGTDEGSKAVVQLSTGGILIIPQDNPGFTKSTKSFWEDETNTD